MTRNLEEEISSQKANESRVIWNILTWGGLFNLLAYFVLRNFSSALKEQLQCWLSPYAVYEKEEKREKERLKAHTKS